MSLVKLTVKGIDGRSLNDCIKYVSSDSITDIKLGSMVITDTKECKGCFEVLGTLVSLSNGSNWVVAETILNIEQQTLSSIGAVTVNDWELLEVELVDDVANDGTGAIIPYSELYAVSVTGVRTLIATVDEKGANYTLIGTRRNANEIGVNAKTAINQLVLDGASWSPIATTLLFSYVVINIANPITPPTFTGTNGVPVPMYSGESGEFEVYANTISFDTTNVAITANAGDKIKISITSLI